MYAVYYSVSDGCTYTSDIVMFVTESEQTAKDAVTLAQLEYAEALKVPLVERPALSRGMTDDQRKEMVDKHYQDIRDYNQRIQEILTVHPDRAEDFSRDDDNSYYYEKVEVR